MGNAASAAALGFLRQLSKGESAERDGERLLLVPVVFLRGFPQAVFSVSGAGFSEPKLGSRTAPFHPRAELGSGESLPCLQHVAWVLSTSPPREWPSS